MSDQGEPATSEDELEEPEVWRSATADAPLPSHRRCVVHVDIDCFYAQVEMLERPELRDKPLGIQQKNIVVTSNYVARARGVTKCCYVADAVQKCPELVLVNGSDLTRYRRMSARIHRVLTRFSRRVERLGFDENFLDVTEAVAERLGSSDFSGITSDVTGHAYREGGGPCSCGCERRLTAGSAVAGEIRRALRDELGITSCAGVGFNKLLAKLVCATHKPDQQTVVFAGGVDSLLLTAGLARGLPGIGSRTAQSLADSGIKTVEDIRRASLAELNRALGGGSAAVTVRALAHGADEAEVKTTSAALSIGVEDGFKRVDNVEECEVKMRELVRRVLVLLQEDGRTPTVLKVSSRRFNKENYYRFRESRQTKIMPSLFARCITHPEEPATVERVLTEAMILLKKMLKEPPFHLTLLGLAVTGFADQSQAAHGGMAKFIQKASTSVPAAKKKESPDRVGDGAPAGVDEGVWAGLPPDIQAELLDQEFGPTRKRRQQTIGRFFSTGGSELKTKSDVESCSVAGDKSSMETVVDVSSDGESDSDPDDPGSPLVSRSACSRTIPLAQPAADPSEQGDSVVSSGAGSCKAAAEVQDLVSVATQRDRTSPPAETAAGASNSPTSGSTNSAPQVSATGETRPARESESRGASGRRSSSVTHSLTQPVAVSQACMVPALLKEEDQSSPAAPEGGTGQDCAPGAAAPSDQPWDADVFSHLPPDIQFELKMARRSQQSPLVSVRRPEPGQRKANQDRKRPLSSTSGNILKFFKK